MITATRLFRWGSHYKLGVTEIDQEHERMAELMNHLYEVHRHGAAREEIAAGLRLLLDAVNEHFSNEERIMQESRYPSVKHHQAEHRFLDDQLREFQRDFEAGRTELSDSMMIYLKDWLRDHILVSDRRLGSFLRDNH